MDKGDVLSKYRGLSEIVNKANKHVCRVHTAANGKQQSWMCVSLRIEHTGQNSRSYVGGLL